MDQINCFDVGAIQFVLALMFLGGLVAGVAFAFGVLHVIDNRREARQSRRASEQPLHGVGGRRQLERETVAVTTPSGRD